MSLRKLSLLIAVTSAGFFSLLQLLPAFRLGDDRVYDFFLRFRPPRERIDNVVFVNVDDAAIARVGVFPWPRSVVADGLLRLKEYGARLAIFDIEFIDKSPTQVDEVYLRDGLSRDYNRHFSEIGTTVAQVLNAVASGRIPPDRVASYIDDVADLITEQRDALYASTLRITSDDDRLLANAAALFGNVWGTLHLQEDPLTGEQALRRPFAEEHFSYPVANSGGIAEGTNIDILPAIPLFAQAVKGAGYTNISPDSDGVRRRILLAQEVQGHWYLQLAFAPLMDLWGRPSITALPGRMVIDGPKKTTIPLDSNGAMLLDWPREDYYDSFKHTSFADFSILDEYLAHIEEYLQFLVFSNTSLFPAVSRSAAVLLEHFQLQREAKRTALEDCSDEAEAQRAEAQRAFDNYIALRDKWLEETADFIEYLSSENYIENEANRIIGVIARGDPDLAAGITEEAERCRFLLECIDIELQAFLSENQKIREKLSGAFCIIGRTDTGTTDIAVNPFHPSYINVGTHAVVLDTIISGSFITPLPILYSVLFTMIFVPLVLVSICGLKPSTRSVFGFVGTALAFCLPLGLFAATRIFLAPLSAILAMASAVIVRELTAFVTSEREKRFIQRAFSTYLAPSVVAELIADPSKLNLGGEKREMTVIFTDIKNFSTISETLDPTNLVRMLNNYLTTMSNIIMENQGTIDKYEGDAIIAFFGAPIYREDHAALACRSALAMKHAEQALNERIIGEGLSPTPLFTRIGINTGEMVVGNMGTDSKMDYTVMGNAVNLAARLEGVNKQYQTSILISEFTKKQAGDGFLSRRLERVQVAGIHTPVLLYELTGLALDADKDKLRLHQTWEEATACYEQRRFAEAADLFSGIVREHPGDAIAAQYARRCTAYASEPPPPEWDAVIHLSEK